MIFRKKVILDTNFLLIPGELGVDIFSELERIMEEKYKVCIMEATMRELEELIERKRKSQEGFNAKLGYIMAKQKNLKTLKGSSSTYADDSIVSYAEKNPDKVIVATQDKELIKRLNKINVKTIGLRQKKYLILR